MVTESNERAKELEKRSKVAPEERIELVDTGPMAQEDDEHTIHEEAPGEDVTHEDHVDDLTDPMSSLTFAGNLQQNGWVPADRLTTENIDDLELEYTFEMDTAGSQMNPIVVPSGDGEPPVMYITQGNQVVRALNARTGEEYWEYRYSDRRPHGPGARNRGVSVWQDKVYFGAHDLHLLALNRYTGELEWITDYASEEQLEIEGDLRIGATAPTLVYDGTVFLGQSGDSFAFTNLTAIDAESGELVWQRKTVDEDEWVGEMWKYSSGAPWMNAAADPETDTVYYMSGNPTPIEEGTIRPGPNKHTNTIFAVEPETGEFKWTHQILPHDMWDYDCQTVPYVIDVEIDGESRRVVSHDNKMGWSYFIDAETGKLLQRSEPYGRQEHHFGQWPDREFLNYPRKAESEDDAGFMVPFLDGVTEFPSDSYSPETGLRYLVSNGLATLFWSGEWDFDPEAESGFMPAGGFTDPEGQGVEYDAELLQVAIDVATGEIEWTTEFEEADGKAWGGGTAATAGGVVFGTSPEGPIVAFDAETGDRLWQHDTEGRISASPVVWDDPAVDTQYVAVASDDTIFAYALETEE